MEMEGLDSNSNSNSYSSSAQSNIAKGKRTKRMRLLSPSGVVVVTTAATTGLTTTTTSCSSPNSGGSSTTTYESEEEDMANCLILLAQGGESHPHQPHHHKQRVEDHNGVKTAKGNGNTITTAAAAATTAVDTKVGFFIYECKTCNRTFPSFQALGGHRASHKKPKLSPEEKKPPPSQSPHVAVTTYDRFEEDNVKNGPPISLQLGHGNNKGKIHECSICGSEFSSGQALGGHMRRHRSSTNTNTVDTSGSNTVIAVATTVSPPRNVLQLDLNLPAPEDDIREAKFQFPVTTQMLVGTPALVDCLY
ncbi:hypothetical protein LR48_Vigan08g145900 [Vigna angularis]|uniref:Zinc finger protein n=2 Tax=Phaseolus angularis TaxID=3914 RepID=A0A0L9V6T0_PHAAN|nr:zinc finger protein ZAT5 [Vigna angularis]KAG2397516.1 Zinc finger protein [Vigna angularis]KOM50632.1 hypothetical protein LR48_Vigan08g145900 [Vigna angularis]BAT90496.1 hypothetical protein VIGAN_06175100 [Vigna angularis var. angularis]